MGGKLRAARFRLSQQQCQKPRQVWKVSDEQNVAGLADEPIAEPVRRVARLQILRR